MQLFVDEKMNLETVKGYKIGCIKSRRGENCIEGKDTKTDIQIIQLIIINENESTYKIPFKTVVKFRIFRRLFYRKSGYEIG